MKKIFAIALVLVMMLSLVACGNDSKSDKVKAYVEDNKAALLSGMEQSFASSSGMTCTSSIRVDGCGIVIDININELDGLGAAEKKLMQEIYDSLDAQFDMAFDQMQKELPELEFFTVNVNEGDGDNIAVVKMD